MLTNFKLKERLENMANEADFQLNKQKNKVANMSRKPDEYFKDQLLFLKMKELKLEDRKRRLDEENKKVYSFKPALSELAKKLKDKDSKEVTESDIPIHERLTLDSKKKRKKDKKAKEEKPEAKKVKS